MKLWRIGTETRKYRAVDLSGMGAAAYPGRWNAEGEAVVYCSPSIAACVLETAAHIDGSGLPLNKYLIEIDVPEDVWDEREVQMDVSKLPPAWDAIPAGMASVDFGSKWLSSSRTALMLVPSVIVPEESIALLNPKHPQSTSITAKVLRKFEYDNLWRKS